jgi:Pretoxin HINT domain
MNRQEQERLDAERRADKERAAAQKEAEQQAYRRRIEKDNDDAAERRKKRTEGTVGGCFPKGTEITTPSGFHDISELQKGDFVIAINQKNGQKQSRKILKKLTHINRKIWRLEFLDGCSLRTTSVHSFSINGKWKKASEIKSGDTIAYYDSNSGFSEKIVKSSSKTNEVEDVYNIIVEADFNFVADGVVAHSFTYFKTVKGLAWSLAESSRLMSCKIKTALRLARESVT